MGLPLRFSRLALPVGELCFWRVLRQCRPEFGCVLSLPSPYNVIIAYQPKKVNSQNAQIGNFFSLKVCAFCLLTFG